MTTSHPLPLDRAAIEELIPHRDPFLFVDRVTETGTDGLVAEWHVPEDAAWFAGHYPGNPILPGVLIAEHTMQCGALWICTNLPDAVSDTVPVAAKIGGARFRRVVRPGDTLVTTVRLENQAANAFFMHADTKCGTERVISIDFTVAAVPEGTV
jgi:3-hydroxyacyl-[acyl-carrier-protein] dehydratase